MESNATFYDSSDLIKKIYPDKFSAFLIFPFGFENNEFKAPKLAKEYIKKDKWKDDAYDLKKGKDYNEYIYFFPYEYTLQTLIQNMILKIISHQTKSLR